MLNEATRQVHSAVVRAVKGITPLTRNALAEADIPMAVREYLDANLAREAERVAEEIKGRRDPWVAENAEVSRARTALSVAASRSIQFPEHMREAAVREATTTVVRYLVRPARTLVETIFADGTNEIAVDEAIERMASLHAYTYFDDVLRHYFDEKGIDHVDRARLDSVLHRVDRQMTSDFSTDEWVEISTPLFQTLAFADAYADGIPAELLRMYFREKEAGKILARLETLDDDAIVSRERLREIIDAPVIEPVVEVAPEQPAQREPASRQKSAAAEQKAPTSRQSPPAADEGPLPLWKQFQGQPAPARKAAEEPADRPADDDAGTPLWQRFRSPAPAERPQQRRPEPPRVEQASTNHRQPAPPATRPPARESLSLEEVEYEVLGPRGGRNRKMFVRQIFDGNEDVYRKALEQIHRSPTWSDASRLIAREVFMRHDVNIYDDAAVAFTDLVEERFAERA